MLRDLVLVCCALACIGLSFRHAYAGVLTWTWIAVMQPYTEVYGPISSSLRMNLVVAVVAVVGWLASKDRKLPPLDAIFIAVLIFLAWMTFNEFFAVFPLGSWVAWSRDWRIIALGVMIWATATNKVRIHALIWVMVASFMYYGAKQGLGSILAGGVQKTIAGTGMYGDNNQFAVAMLMSLPLIDYLRAQSANRYVRIGLTTGFVLTIFSIVGSYSRGGLVGLAALSLVWWVRSRNKIGYVLIALAIAYPVYHFMPQSFWDRADTINHVGEDGSFQGRVTAWKVAYYYARDHFPIGAGLDGPQQPVVFNHYFPGQEFHAAHSIFFQVLGDLGFMGLAIYLFLLFAILWSCSGIRRAGKINSEVLWARDLSNAIQLSIAAFCLAGSGVSLAYADPLFIFAGIVPRLSSLIGQRERWLPSQRQFIRPALTPANESVR